MLGRTFLMLVHVGRITAQPHDTVAMVLADDRSTGEVVIFSGWGPDADWLRNLHAGPAREVRLARERFVPEHRFLDEAEAVAVVGAFRHRHPGRVWLASAILGWGDLRSDAVLREFVQDHPFVALRPTRRWRSSRVPIWRSRAPLKIGDPARTLHRPTRFGTRCSIRSVKGRSPLALQARREHL
jgi:deazaflavin-dependent oxidoreductase (nitroreductase family)